MVRPPRPAPRAVRGPDQFCAGFNATLLAYGQTGSGKTFTMGTAFSAGDNFGVTTSSGVVPRAVHDLFARRASANRSCTVRLSFLEIHHEEVRRLAG